MPAGLQLWNANGIVQVDLTDRLPKIIDVREVSLPTNGAWVTVDLGLAGKRTNWAVMPLYCWKEWDSSRTPRFSVVMELTGSGYLIRDYRTGAAQGNTIARVVSLGL